MKPAIFGRVSRAEMVEADSGDSDTAVGRCDSDMARGMTLFLSSVGCDMSKRRECLFEMISGLGDSF